MNTPAHPGAAPRTLSELAEDVRALSERTVRFERSSTLGRNAQNETLSMLAAGIVANGDAIRELSPKVDAACRHAGEATAAAVGVGVALASLDGRLTERWKGDDETMGKLLAELARLHTADETAEARDNGVDQEITQIRKAQEAADALHLEAQKRAEHDRASKNARQGAATALGTAAAGYLTTHPQAIGDAFAAVAKLFGH